MTWSGTVRPALNDLAVVPRPVNGTAADLARHRRQRGVLGPRRQARPAHLLRHHRRGAARFAPLAELYRRTAAQAGHTGEDIKVSVAALGLIAPTKKEALERFYPGWHNLNIEMGKLRGWPAPDKRQFRPRPTPPARTTSATRTKSPNASCTCTATWATCATSCRWTSAACPRSTSWNP